MKPKRRSDLSINCYNIYFTYLFLIHHSVDLNSPQKFQLEITPNRDRSEDPVWDLARNGTRWKTETSRHARTQRTDAPCHNVNDRIRLTMPPLSTERHVSPLETRRPRGKKAAHTCAPAASPFHPPQECVLGTQVDNQRPCNWGTENSVASPWQHPAIP